MPELSRRTHPLSCVTHYVSARPTSHSASVRENADVTPDALGSPAIRGLFEATLRRNWREGVRERDRVRFAYTQPSPGHYPFQWYWDSCFAAIVWRRFDATHSRAELESLLAAQREDGFIGHT